MSKESSLVNIDNYITQELCIFKFWRMSQIHTSGNVMKVAS